MSKLFDHTIDILVATVTIFFLWCICNIMMWEVRASDKFRTQCVAAGMQYVNGSCVK